MSRGRLVGNSDCSRHWYSLGDIGHLRKPEAESSADDAPTQIGDREGIVGRDGGLQHDSMLSSTMCAWAT